MADKSPAKHRIEADIQRLITTMIQRDANDPCFLGMVITSVDVSRDNQSAVIKVHGMKRDEADILVDKLKRMTPHFEHALRRSMGKKRLPKLNFSWDTALDAGNDMVELLNNLDRA
ncbi:MAG: 30S ribosome-binding factor RbfA [Mariprofundaceae bacterium]|nr:30S ribosome-binding factor RbfA [Mariprofundaceae bacterium]